MKYYVVSDVHGYYSQMIQALQEKGFFHDTEPHKLIVCGDLFDRGNEAIALQEFILKLMEKEEVILIRGNHEDLLEDLLNKWMRKSYLEYHHISNGTVDTVLQLTSFTLQDLYKHSTMIGHALLKTPCIQTILPAMVNYFETEHYIFVHGWIPCTMLGNGNQIYYYPIENWRNVTPKQWKDARWINGMEAWNDGIKVKGKTIVCGHWHTSFGHSRYEGNGTEFEKDAIFTPFMAPGILAIDACTVLSGFVNCVVIEDEPI